MKKIEVENPEDNQLSPKKKGLAIVSLIFGIIGTAPALGTASIVAIICGHLALNKIKKDPDVYGGKGLAIAGLVLGYLGLAIGLFLGIMNGLIKNKLGGL